MKLLMMTMAMSSLVTIVACGSSGGAGGAGGAGAMAYTPCSKIQVDNSDFATDNPLRAYQWYLDKAEVIDAWNIDGVKKGAGIEIAVVDNAVQIDHEDLAANINRNNSINVFVADGHPERRNPTPDAVVCAEKDASHGTAAAGIIAAANNKRGIIGIAHDAEIWGANLILRSGFTMEELRQVFSHRVTETAISSNSWGPSSPTVLAEAFSTYDGLIDNGLTNGFSKKGISYVFSAGNSREAQESSKNNPIPDSGNMASYSELLNHRGVMAVCAVRYDNEVSSYSEPGPNLWLCGHSSSGDNPPPGTTINEGAASTGNYYLGLPTTDLSGSSVGFNRGANTIFTSEDDNAGVCTNSVLSGFISDIYNFNSPMLVEGQSNCTPGSPGIASTPIPWPASATTSYHRYFTGTSAAAPVVSGVIGLVRATDKDLTWRDVKLIMAESATPPVSVVSEANEGVTYNTGGSAISSNYSYHSDYGFGIVNASKAVKLAQKWTTVPAEITWTSALTSAGTAITYSGAIDFIEYVQVEIVGGQEQSNFGDLKIELTSPSNTISTLAKVHQCVKKNANNKYFTTSSDCKVFTNSFTFGIAAHLGENPVASNGVWQLTVTNKVGTAIALKYRLKIYGHNNPNRP